MPLQVGGGYRTLDAIATALDAGADRVMIGTAALGHGFLEAAVERFGSSLVVAVDVRDGSVAVEGWTQVSELTPGDLAHRCVEAGVSRLLVTSAARDGSLAGTGRPRSWSQVRAAGLPVLAAGGISSLDDLRALQRADCEGAVVGSALSRALHAPRGARRRGRVRTPSHVSVAAGAQPDPRVTQPTRSRRTPVSDSAIS